MARYRTAYNPTDATVVVDDEGRTLGGREYGPVVEAAPEVRAARDRGALVFVDRPKSDDGDLVADAVAAFDATDELNAADTPAEVAELADEHGAPPTKAARKAAASTQEAKAR